MRLYGITMLFLVVLSACGGGGGDSQTMSGTISDPTGAILPDPATTAQPLTLTVAAAYVGAFTPQSTVIDIPFTLTRTTGAAASYTGQVHCTQATGSPGAGSYTCTGSLEIPPQPAGSQQYCLTWNPVGNFSGTRGTACAPVTVTAP